MLRTIEVFNAHYKSHRRISLHSLDMVGKQLAHVKTIGSDAHSHSCYVERASLGFRFYIKASFQRASLRYKS